MIAKSGDPVVEVDPLVKLGGDPVASNVDNRFDPLVGLEIVLDMRLNIFFKKTVFYPSPATNLPWSFCGHLRQNLGRRKNAVRECNQFN